MMATVLLLVSVMGSLRAADDFTAKDDAIFTRMKRQRSEMADVYMTLGSFGARLGSAEGQVASMKALESSQVSAIKAMEDRLADAERKVSAIQALEARLAVAEAQVSALRAMEIKLADAESKLQQLTALKPGSGSGCQPDLCDVLINVASCEAAIAALETRVTAEKDQSNAFETRLTAEENQSNALEARLTEAETRLTAVKEGNVEAPTSLRTSEVTDHSFRASWTAPGPVEKYRVEYMNMSGHRQQVIVDGTVTTVVLDDLNPQTEYLVNVYFVVGEESSEPLKGTETTRNVEAPTNLRTSEVTYHSFRARWTAPGGPVEKYRVEYMTVQGHPQQVIVDGTVTTVVLENLNPQTEYLVSVYSVVGGESSEPLKGELTTQMKNRCVGWKVSGSSCYYVSTERKSWEESRRDCEGRGDGAHLVAINSRAEQMFINTILPGRWTWIGLNDKDTEGDFVWLDQTRPSETFWYSGEPDNYGGNQDCVSLYTYAENNWADSVCGYSRYWICERDL